MIAESIKEGFRITNRNWQLVLLKVAAGIINLIGLFIIVGIPVIISIFTLGMDIAQAKDLLPQILDDPVQILSKYLGLAILITLSLLVYLTFASFLILYVFGGTIGMLKNSAFDMQFKFSLSSFFREAKRLFFPLLWLFTAAILVMLGILMLFGILAGIVITFSGAYIDAQTTVSVFVIYFLSLLGIATFLIGVIFAAYAAIALAVEGGGVRVSFRNALNFIKNKPVAFLFYVLVFSALIFANFVLIGSGAALSSAPGIGVLFGFPYQIISFFIRSYLGIAMWGALLEFYLKGTQHPVRTASAAVTYDI